MSCNPCMATTAIGEARERLAKAVATARAEAVILERYDRPAAVPTSSVRYEKLMPSPTGITRSKRRAEKERFAAMEPGLTDRDHGSATMRVWIRAYLPQWSPVLPTGITGYRESAHRVRDAPQWSPVLPTGITVAGSWGAPVSSAPQWSPVLPTGITLRGAEIHA